MRHIKTALVFPSLAGTRLDPNHLRRALRPAMAKAGIVDCHFHDLRHTFATRLVQSGVDLYKGATATRAQVADDDATLCASLPGKPARWSGDFGPTVTP